MKWTNLAYPWFAEAYSANIYSGDQVYAVWNKAHLFNNVFLLCLFLLSAEDGAGERRHWGPFAGKPSMKGCLNQKVWNCVLFLIYVKRVYEICFFTRCCQLFICVFVQTFVLSEVQYCCCLYHWCIIGIPLLSEQAAHHLNCILLVGKKNTASI